MMFADMLIEFVYLCLRIVYNVVKYSVIGIIKLVKYLKRQHIRRRYKKQVRKGNFTISRKNGKYVLTIGGISENE
jgi:hypothetical protein